MNQWVVNAYPWLVGIGVAVVVFLGIRLNLHLGQGSTSAGPLRVDPGQPPGQERTPWELRAIDQQLRSVGNRSGAVVRRYDLTATVNRLSASAGIMGVDEQLPLSASEADLVEAVTRLEQALDLPPFDPMHREDESPT